MDRYVLDIWRKVQFNFFFVFSLVTSIFLLFTFFEFSLVKLFFIVTVAYLVKALILRDYSIKNLLKGLLFAYTVIALFVFIPGRYGFLGVVLLLLGLAGFRIWKGWSIMLSSMRMVETRLFGKALDRAEWVDGEKPGFKKKEVDDEK